MARTFGIVNVTRDSFSDGGRYLAAPDAIARGRSLLADGADVIDVGAESTHPDAEDVPAEVEQQRLLPVVKALAAARAAVSVDTRKPEIVAALVAAGASWWNDVDGLRSPAALAVARALPPHVRFVAMFSRSSDGRAVRGADDTGGLLGEIRAFFVERLAAFAAAGIARERIVLDPGMGFFLGDTHAHSLLVLRHLGALRAEFGPLLVSVSRKSFVGALTGAVPAARGPGTLAAELWAARAGVDWIRTHDVRALRDALAVEHAIEEQA